MFDTSLFIGIPVDATLAQAIEGLNPHKRELFIANGSDYLHEAVFEGQRYLGKCLDKVQEMSQFELIEANIVSLITKLFPDYPAKEKALLLFAQTSKQ